MSIWKRQALNRGRPKQYLRGNNVPILILRSMDPRTRICLMTNKQK